MSDAMSDAHKMKKEAREARNVHDELCKTDSYYVELSVKLRAAKDSRDHYQRMMDSTQAAIDSIVKKYLDEKR
jgi:hypothetical protein